MLLLLNNFNFATIICIFVLVYAFYASGYGQRCSTIAYCQRYQRSLKLLYSSSISSQPASQRPDRIHHHYKMAVNNQRLSTSNSEALDTIIVLLSGIQGTSPIIAILWSGI